MKILKPLENFLRKGVRTKSIVQFTRQLATLISAGLPLLKSLKTLYEQFGRSLLKEIIKNIADEVESGSNFSEALSRYPRVFPDIYVNMIRAGELGGMLEEILRRLAEFLEKQQRLREKIRSALMYPCFVLLVATLILIMLMVFVIPTFTNMFAELGGALPLATRILILSSELVRKFWFILIGLFFASIIFYKVLIRDRNRKLVIDRIKLKTPIIGELISKIAVARFARTLGTLLSSGVPILGALLTVKDTVGNEVISRAIVLVHDNIKEGESVATPMEASGAFPPLVVKMVNIGEETGQLDKMLVHIADNFEEEVDIAVSGLTALLEPLLIVIMGLVVGFIVISMFMPLFTLAKLIG